MTEQEKHAEAIKYIREKIDQMLVLMGTLPLRQEELDDETLIALDPIGIIVQSFEQVLEHLKETNHQLEVSQREIRTILDTVQAAIVVMKPDETIEDCNILAQEFFFENRPRSEIIGSTTEEVCICGGEIESKVLEQYGSEEPGVEFSAQDRWFSVKATKTFDDKGELEKIVFLYADITAQKKAMEELNIYAQVFDNTDEGILVTDDETRIINSNRAFSNITGYSVDELRGSKPNLLGSGMHDDAFYDEMWRNINEKGHWRGEIFDRRKDGSLTPLWQTISTIVGDEGKASHYISIISDISSLKDTQSRLDYLAHHDPLTNLPNRLLLHDRLDHAIKRGERDGTAAALLFIDLDRFKTINDSLGHHIGDKLLQQVARRLLALVRQSDSIARLGGDEFVILLEDIKGNEDAARLATKVIETLRAPFTIEEHELHIGCSIGISITPDDGDDPVTLLKNADTAMYKVKESGRDSYHIYSTELSEVAEERLRIESALRRAVEAKQFYLHYQPIVDARTNKVTSAEALIRWQHDEMGQVSPVRFIPIAEESNLIIAIGQQVLDMSVAQLVQWREQGVELEYLSVNVCGQQLYHSEFAENLVVLLQENDIPGSQFQIEITENVLMENMERCIEQLNALREYGIRVAIDDFGMGYSSLAYLRRLPLDIIKVDRSFVMDIPGDKNDCVIALAIANLARSLELESVAEGIETEEQRAFMQAAGCHRFQGFLFSRPIDSGAFVEYWKTHH